MEFKYLEYFNNIRIVCLTCYKSYWKARFTSFLVLWNFQFIIILQLKVCLFFFFCNYRKPAFVPPLPGTLWFHYCINLGAFRRKMYINPYGELDIRILTGEGRYVKVISLTMRLNEQKMGLQQRQESKSTTYNLTYNFNISSFSRKNPGHANLPMS